MENHHACSRWPTIWRLYSWYMVYPRVSLEINGKPSCLLMMANHMEALFKVYDVPIVSLEINRYPACLLIMANGKMALFMVHDVPSQSGD